MRVTNAYKIEKFFSKFHIHVLDVLVSRILRLYLNEILPGYYKRHRFKDGRSSKEYTGRDVILSMTTYPKRMEKLPVVLESLLRQTVKPTSFQLWVASDQYPDREKLLRDMRPFTDRGLQILFCDDLKAHKKYYYAMKNNPEAVVVTVDDDVFYPETLLEELLETYIENPHCVVVRRAHLMKFENDEFLPYDKWNHRAAGCKGPDLYLCATGCAGCLYPPNLLPKEVFNKEVFKEICLYADDIWLKCMEQINHIPTVLTGVDNPEIITTYGSETDALMQQNLYEGKNDQQLKAVTEYYEIRWV